MVRARKQHARQALPHTGSNYNRDEASDRKGNRVPPDIGLPWRVHEFEVWKYDTAKPVYHVLDRHGLVVCVFMDLQIARAMTITVNLAHTNNEKLD